MKVAFCFLTQGNLLQPKLWDAFFADVPDNRFTIYCHPKHPEQIVDGLLGGRVISQSVKTHHAHISLVEATLALFRAAYVDDSDNEYFVLVSESAIPIVPFGLVYDALAGAGRRSLIPYRLAAEQADHYARLQSVTRPMLFASAFYVHDQWIILHRRHVQAVIDQSFLWLFERVFAPDEHYFLNVLFHLKGVPLGDIINARTTFVNWREATRDTEIHPATGSLWTIVRPKTYQLLTPADLAEAQGAWFFRKITASGDCSLVLPRLAQRRREGQTMISSSRRPHTRDVEPIAIRERELSQDDKHKGQHRILGPSASATKFRQGLACHQQGKLVEAERHYNAALKSEPDNFDALHMLGVIALQTGNFERGVKIIRKAVALNENSAVAFNNLAKGLKDLGRFDEAIVYFERAITLAPSFADAQFGYGSALHLMNRLEPALVHFEKAIALNPKFIEALNNRGLALAKLKRFEEALDSYERALAVRPNFADAHINRGNVLNRLMRFGDALASFDKATACRPHFAEAHCSRGDVLVELERFDEAVAAFDRAIAIRPDFAEAHRSRGAALANLNRFGEAIASFDRAIAIKPRYVDAWISRIEALFTCNRNDEAVKSARAAIDIDPDNALCRFLSCYCELRILYDNEDDVEARRKAYESKLRAICSDYRDGRLRKNMIEAGSRCKPFYLAYQNHNDRDLQALYGKLVCRAIGAQFGQAALPAPPETAEPVRVGFVSSHFYSHSNWKIPLKGWMSQLNRDRFKIFGYHVGRRRDQETEVAAKLCFRFVHRAMPLEAWREEILADAPHVLIYPGLLMDELSLQLAAQRLAPVQCNSWGHPETSGLPTLDYFLSSDMMEPADADEHYTERLVRLPNLSIYYEPIGTSPARMTRDELGMRSDAVVFWCGQSLYKYLPQHDFVFAKIAKLAGNCQFVFIKHAKEAAVADLFNRRLDSVFTEWGLTASDHCLFIDSLSVDRFVAAIGNCDIFLDSIGWSGCNSTLESLVHNLPVVTFRGALMRGRHSSAIFNRIGVEELVADSIDEYVSIATRLATNSAERKRISLRIDRNKHTIYRDRDCIAGLEDFIADAARGRMPEKRPD